MSAWPRKKKVSYIEISMSLDGLTVNSLERFCCEVREAGGDGGTPVRISRVIESADGNFLFKVQVSQ